MNINDLLVLVNAGFTRNDIMALASGKVDQITTTTDPQPEPETQTQTQTTDTDTTRADIQELKDTLSALQRANLLAAQQPAGAGEKQTIDDVWKNFFEEDKK